MKLPTFAGKSPKQEFPDLLVFNLSASCHWKYGVMP